MKNRRVSTTPKPVPKDFLIFVPRNEWKAKKLDARNDDKLNVPLSRVVIIHTVSGACLTRETCVSYVKQVETQHVNIDKFYDIGYNFVSSKYFLNFSMSNLYLFLIKYSS